MMATQSCNMCVWWAAQSCTLNVMELRSPAICAWGLHSPAICAWGLYSRPINVKGAAQSGNLWLAGCTVLQSVCGVCTLLNLCERGCAVLQSVCGGCTVLQS